MLPTTRAPDPAALFSRLAAQPRLAVAVSGGSDSLTLLLLAHEWSKVSGAGIVALTVDHGLRPESAGEAAGVAALCASHGIAHRTLAWQGHKPATGISAAARLARHRLLADAAMQAGAGVVLVGHTMDDQAETFAMRMARRDDGGSRGAAGIAPATLFDERCWFVRPLIATRRAALRDLLSARDVRWIDDPSNSDRRNERARIRAGLAHDTVERLAAQAHAAAARRSDEAVLVAGLIASAVDVPTPGLLRLRSEALDTAHALPLLRVLLAVAGGVPHLPSENAAQALLARLRAGPCRATLARAVATRRQGAVLFHRENRDLPQPAPASGDPWDGRFRLRSLSDDAIVAPLGPTPRGEGIGAATAATVVAAGATLPGTMRGDGVVVPLTTRKQAGPHAIHVLAPFSGFLPSFDLPTAVALARILGIPDLPALPWDDHKVPAP